MTLDEQVDDILKSAANLFEPENPDDLELFRGSIKGSLKAGWTRKDILKFMSYTEEMCYSGTEEQALKCMKIISDRNNTYFGGGWKMDNRK